MQVRLLNGARMIVPAVTQIGSEAAALAGICTRDGPTDESVYVELARGTLAVDSQTIIAGRARILLPGSSATAADTVLEVDLAFHTFNEA